MSEISKLEQKLVIKKIDNNTVNLSINDNDMLLVIVGQFDQNLKIYLNWQIQKFTSEAILLLKGERKN